MSSKFMREMLHIVMGNPLVTYQGVHYAAQSGCGDEENFDVNDEAVSGEVTDPAACEPKSVPIHKHPGDIVYVNRQSSALEVGLKSAELEVRKRLIAAFPDSREVRVICADNFALRDLVKLNAFHTHFNRRFSGKAGKNLSECGDLIDRLRVELQSILWDVRLHVQLDHSDNVKNFLNPEDYDSLVEKFAAGSRNNFKHALVGGALLCDGITLNQLLPQVAGQFQVPLDWSCFRLEDVSVIFERVIRDHLYRMAVNLDWDETVNENPVTKKPFYVPELGEEPRNAINFVGPDMKPVVACVGVVAGVPALISHQSDGGVVRLFMEEDSVRRRVDQRIIEAGLGFYEHRVATAPSIPADKHHEEMKMPKPVRTELFMARTGAEQVISK